MPPSLWHTSTAPTSSTNSTTFVHSKSLTVRKTQSCVAAYRPHSYCSFKKISPNLDEDPQSVMLPDDTPKDYKYFWRDIKDMIRFHHMLVSSIKDRIHLQRVVFTDSYGLWTLILENGMLAALRNCTGTNLEHVLVRHRSGSAINVDVPYPENHLGFMSKELCFSIIEWREKATDESIHKDEDVTGIPADLPERSPLLTKVLGILLEDRANVEVNDSKEILELLSNIKSDGNLLWGVQVI